MGRSGICHYRSYVFKKIVLTSDCPNGPRNIVQDRINGFKFKMDDKKEFLDKFYEISDLQINKKNEIKKNFD